MPFIPISDNDKKEMLSEINASSIDELFNVIPESIRLKKFDSFEGCNEYEATMALGEIAKKNRAATDALCFAGAGTYDHFVPAAIDPLVSRGEFYTAYTPYQPEVSQGTLQAIFEYQSMICTLTGMEVANASMYDGASALAEAILLSLRNTRKNKIFISKVINPLYRQVINTYLTGQEIEMIEVPINDGKTDIKSVKNKIDKDTACFVIQNPNFYGVIEDGKEIRENLDDKIDFIVCADPNSLGILEAPGNYGANIVVGDCQPFGIPLSFGGPSNGYFAVDKAHMRKMPGRVVGQTNDVDGKIGYVLTLQAREQHIRREKATSNICSNQQLSALRSLVYMSLAGEEGLKEVSYKCAENAHYLADKISSLKGFSLRFNSAFYKEFVVDCPTETAKICKDLLDNHGIIAGISLSRFDSSDNAGLLIAVTEKRSKKEMDLLVEALAKWEEK
jgi:glycine dehydrogenase subunit 1